MELVQSSSIIALLFSTLFNYSSYKSSIFYTIPHWEHTIKDSTDHWILYSGGKVLEENFYKNGKVDSFHLTDYYNNTSYGGELKKNDSFYTNIGFWVSSDYMKHDSLSFTCWQPVEAFHVYHYEIKKDSITVWKATLENTPVFPFSMAQSNDTLNHIYNMHLRVTNEQGESFVHIQKLFKEHDKKVDFNW